MSVNELTAAAWKEKGQKQPIIIVVSDFSLHKSPVTSFL